MTVLKNIAVTALVLTAVGTTGTLAADPPPKRPLSSVFGGGGQPAKPPAKSLMQRAREAASNLPEALTDTLGITTSATVPQSAAAGDDATAVQEQLDQAMAMNTELIEIARVQEGEIARLQLELSRHGSVVAPLPAGPAPVQPGSTVGRDSVVGEIFDVLARRQKLNTIPFVYGRDGVGKTALVDSLQEAIARGNFPQVPAYQERLQGAKVVKVTPGQIRAKNVPAIDKKTIIVVDDAQMLKPEEAMEFAKSVGAEGTPLIFLSNERGKHEHTKSDRALAPFVQPIEIPELSEGDLRRVMSERVVPTLANHFRNGKGQPASLDAGMLDLALAMGPELHPELSRLGAASRFIGDILQHETKRAAGGDVNVGRGTVEHFLDARYPGVGHPLLGAKFTERLEARRTALRGEFVGQERDVDAMIDLWREAKKAAPGKGTRIVVVAGPNGNESGLIGGKFAESVLGSRDRSLEIDVTSLTDENKLMTLFGTPAGHKGEEKAGGTLGDFLRGKGKGENVITFYGQFNPLLLERLATVAEKGFYLDNKGERVELGKSIFRFVTTKGGDKIFPPSVGVTMSDAQIRDHLAGLTPTALRGILQEPSATNIFDASGKWPDSFLDAVSRYVTSVPPTADEAVRLAAASTHDWATQLSNTHGANVEVSPATVEQMTRSLYRRAEGMRNLRRALASAYTGLDRDAESGALREGKLVFTAEPHRGPELFVDNAAGTRHAVTATLAAPKVADVFEDPQARDHLMSLGTRLKKHVFGQDEVANAVASEIQGHRFDSSSKDSQVFLFLGPTGLGKTELAKGLATEHFGDASRISQIDLGNAIKTESDIPAFFGLSGQMQNAGRPSLFHEAVMRGENVVLLDEIGNIGGPPPAHASAGEMEKHMQEKRKLQMAFQGALYQILQEGFYTPPNGERIPLNGIKFVITSNELQHLLSGMPDDEQKLLRHEEINHPDFLREELIRNGSFSPAFLGRIGKGVYYFKPLVGDAAHKVTAKFLRKGLESLAADKGFGGATISDASLQTAKETFYTHSAGGRSIGDLYKRSVRSFFTDSVAKLYGEEVDALPGPEAKRQYREKVKIDLTFSDNYEGRFRYDGATAPDRKVEAVLRFETPNGVREFRRDLTSVAPPKKLLGHEEVAHSALHQAAKLVVNDPSLTRRWARYATVKPTEEEIGFVQFQQDSRETKKPTRESYIARIAVEMAGLAARERDGNHDFSGMASDMKAATDLAREAIERHMLASSREAFRVLVLEGAGKFSSQMAEAEIQTLLEEGEKRAKEKVEAHWAEIQRVQKALTDSPTGSLKGEELAAVGIAIKGKGCRADAGALGGVQ